MRVEKSKWLGIVSRRPRAQRLIAFRHIAQILGAIFKLGEVMKKDQIYLADGAIALFSYQKFSQTAQVFTIALVNLFAENEADQIRILFDGAGFAKIAQLRSMIPLPGFRGAAELRENQHRNTQLLGQQFHAARNGADFLVAVLESSAAAHQL